MQDINHSSSQKLEDTMLKRYKALDALKVIETVCNNTDREMNRLYLGTDTRKRLYNVNIPRDTQYIFK